MPPSIEIVECIKHKCERLEPVGVELDILDVGMMCF